MQFWSIPMFFSDDEPTIHKVEECFHDYNLPLTGQADRALLKAYMFASGNSDKCIRNSFAPYVNPIRLCDPLADENIYDY